MTINMSTPRSSDKPSSSTTEPKQASRAKGSDSRTTMKSDKEQAKDCVHSMVSTGCRTSKTTLVCDINNVQPPSAISTTSVIRRPSDISPDDPLDGEKPNDMLQRLYELWRIQLSPSYRPHVCGNPEATAEYNLRSLRDLYPQDPHTPNWTKRVAQVMVFCRKVQIIQFASYKALYFWAGWGSGGGV